MKNLKFSFPFLFIVLFGFAGCAQKTPDDMPKLYPCKVTVTSDAGPLGEAMVTLVAEEGKWSAVGDTDASGTALLRTNGTYPGVAEGRYKVTVQKYKVVNKGEEVEPEVTPLIAPAFSNIRETTLSCTIEPKNNELSFSVK